MFVFVCGTLEHIYNQYVPVTTAFFFFFYNYKATKHLCFEQIQG